MKERKGVLRYGWQLAVWAFKCVGVWFKVDDRHHIYGQRLDYGVRRLPQPVVLHPTPAPAPMPTLSHPPQPALPTAPAVATVAAPTLAVRTKVPAPVPHAVGAATEPEELKAIHPIEQAFEELGVAIRVVDTFHGPLLDIVSIMPAKGVRGQVVAGAVPDLARLLGLESIRVVMNGVQAGGRAGCMLLEIARPINERKTVMFTGCIQSEEWRETKAVLPVLMGVDVRGQIVIADFARFPHAIVSGQTEGGKTVWLKTMLLGWMMRLTPEQLRIVIISPKPSSFLPFFDMPHLLKPVITDMEQAANEIAEMVVEMERRFALFAAAGTENITEYNATVSSEKRVPSIVVVNDEIMAMVDVLKTMRAKAKKEYTEAYRKERDAARREKRDMDEVIERIIPDPDENLQMLLQKAREAGIYLALCTQRPVVAAINGTGKSNAPVRVVFAMTSAGNSVIALEEGGAEKLLGRGDMLFRQTGMAGIKRIHGCFVENSEIRLILEPIKAKYVICQVS